MKSDLWSLHNEESIFKALLSKLDKNLFLRITTEESHCSGQSLSDPIWIPEQKERKQAVALNASLHGIKDTDDV